MDEFKVVESSLPTYEECITNEIDPPTYDESVKNVQRSEDKVRTSLSFDKRRFVNGKSFLLIYEARYYRI